jgi:YebC/PmpR family DNA-binding regulatory protein
LAGHNKWSKIKHRKAVVDKRRGKVWTKISKAIIVAAKHGGGDPDSNLTLRYAIDEARYANMPRDTIERAIKKGAGGGETANYENNRYECYGPGGVAIIVDALTDNRTRTITDLRNVFSKHGGNVGASGCVGYLFQARGTILVNGEGVSEDKVMEAAIEAGAVDAQAPDDSQTPVWTILTEIPAFNAVKERIEKAGLTITQAELGMVPDNLVQVRGEQARQVVDLVDAIEDLDDVQKVYTNADIPDEELS